MDESLRWLLANKKAKQAERVLRKACKFNGKSYENLLKTVLREDMIFINGENHRQSDQKKQNEVNIKDSHDEVGKKRTKLSFKDVLWSSTMRNISVIICYSWMVNSLTYYGITLLSTSLAGDPYVNFLIGAALEIPSTLCMYFLLTRFGRKIVAMWFTGAAGVSLLVTVLLAILTVNTPSLSLVQTGLTLFGKFCISASFNIMWLFTPELYPTNLRNVGTGMSSMGARIAASASPFFSILARKAVWAPGALFSAACFLCVFLLSFLPETKFRELPSTIEEVEAWYRSDRQNKSKGAFKRVTKQIDEENIEHDKNNKVV
ncbi:solute carrier family 22 member 6-A [Elysia marginata]|uniref:Solute carrier family 22 member 6-A n=1 Tax=Elysia marginata TaxID=1093978 RepID=A0AAV4GPR9_9GAST|nr:solute carrier family 22 member 6-A [Elysia marginata]